MSPSPYQPRDIVRVLASVDRTLHTFFYDNSHLPTISRDTGAKKLNTQAPETDTPPSCTKPKRGPPRPGVVLSVSPDYATVALFTTLHGKPLSEIKGLLRPIVATILPVNHKRDAAAPGWLQTLAVHPTWHAPEVAKQTLCLCLKHQVLISELKQLSWKGESTMVGERFRMCRGDFRLLQQLCERNERLRGLFVSDIRWMLEVLSLDDLVTRCD